MENKSVTLLAKDFENTDFYKADFTKHKASCGCAIEKAVYRTEATENVGEYVTGVVIDGVTYGHPEYGPSHFRLDAIRAKKAGYDTSIIRVINLVKA